jgi:hypothetical protein
MAYVPQDVSSLHLTFKLPKVVRLQAQDVSSPSSTTFLKLGVVGTTQPLEKEYQHGGGI